MKEFELCCGKYRLRLGEKTVVMGVLNVTPDSFFDGGKHSSLDDALSYAHSLVAAGADIIDIGGESTRPGSLPVSSDEERKRVIPVISHLAQKLNIPISVDTSKSIVAREAIKAGASIINDITALRGDPFLGEIAAEYNLPLILMHMQGTPKNMQENPHYRSLIPEIISFLERAIKRAIVRGVKEENILIDPGIGFGKKVEHNLEIIKSLPSFAVLKKPIVIGLSRKSFIGSVLNLPVEARLEGSLAAAVCAVLNGAHIVRVHDVAETVRAMRMIDAIKMGEKFTSCQVHGY
jgi:dihydropteroate synthase